MTEKTTVSEEFIILRKIAYRETGLLVYGISPQYGKLSFVVHGARKISRTKYSGIDVFRLTEVEFNPNKSGLRNWKRVETLRDFSPLASNTVLFNSISKLAAFALENTMEDIPCPDLFQTVKVTMGRYATPLPDELSPRKLALFCSTAVLITWLYENGVLPEIENPKQLKIIKAFLAMGSGGRGILNLSDEYVENLRRWAVDVACRSGCGQTALSDFC